MQGILTSWVLIFVAGFVAGYSVPPIMNEPTSSITTKQAILILDEARKNHQYYIDFPFLQERLSGDTAFNQKWVHRYDLLKKLIGELDANKN